jgi:exoribonuclease R
LRTRGSMALRRVVRTPRRWDRIQAIAAPLGVQLPDQPDARALGDFLAARQTADPLRFPELSLSVLKCMGPGEYVVEHPGFEREGHFGLAVEDYSHSTAPNRRYADLAMQRLIKACLGNLAPPYAESELAELAVHCNERESAARHVERFMRKVAAAILLCPRVGEKFDAIVTGVAEKGTFARLLTAPAEGRVMRGWRGLDVGDRVRVRLCSVDVERGFVDFEAVG